MTWPEDVSFHSEKLESIQHRVERIERRLKMIERFGVVSQNSEILLTRRKDKADKVLDWTRSLKLQVSVHGYKFDLNIFPKFLDLQGKLRG